MAKRGAPTGGPLAPRLGNNGRPSPTRSTERPGAIGKPVTPRPGASGTKPGSLASRLGTQGGK